MNHRLTSIAAVALLATTACASGDADDARAQTSDTADSSPDDPTTTGGSEPAPATTTTTAEPTTTEPDPTTTTSTTSVPSTTTTTTTTTTVPAPSEPEARSWADDCESEPLAPPFLNSGAPVGDPVLGETDAGLVTATWGEGTPDEIMQVLNRESDDTFAIAESFDEVITVNGFEAAVVPVGPPLGPIGIDIRDTDGTCLRQYFTPGSLGDTGIDGAIDEITADDYVTRWLDALAEGSTPDVAGSVQVPLRATTPLPLEPFVIVEFGSGDDQIDAVAGDFGPPAAWSTGGALVLETDDQNALTGDAVIVQAGPDDEFDDEVLRIAPATIDVAEPGGVPIDVRSLDGGGIVILNGHDDDPRVRIRRYIQNPPGVFAPFGDGFDREALGDSELRITFQGVTFGGDVIFGPNPSNPDAWRPLVQSDPPFGVFGELEVKRTDDADTSMTWMLDVEIDTEFPPGSGGLQVEPFGEGALVVAQASSTGEIDPAFVVLDADGSGIAYDLDGWRVADVRPEGVLLTRNGPDGVELAAVRPAG